MPYKAAVFDLDGTLLDTLADLTAAVNHALSAFSLPTRTKEEVRGFVGNGIKVLLHRASGFNERAVDGLLVEFKAYYGAHCKDETRPYAGVLALLKELKSRGVLAAVLSNKADFAVKLLAQEYFAGLLCEAVGENEAAGIRKKPAPDALLAVMEKLGVSAEETVYIGDSEVDIQTAQNAGVDCISVAWGFKDEAFLKEHGGKIIVRTPSELARWIWKD